MGSGGAVFVTVLVTTPVSLFCDCNALLDFWGSSLANAQNVNVCLVPMGIYDCGILLQLKFLEKQ